MPKGTKFASFHGSSSSSRGKTLMKHNQPAIQQSGIILAHTHFCYWKVGGSLSLFPNFAKTRLDYFTSIIHPQIEAVASSPNSFKEGTTTRAAYQKAMTFWHANHLTNFFIQRGKFNPRQPNFRPPFILVENKPKYLIFKKKIPQNYLGLGIGYST